MKTSNADYNCIQSEFTGDVGRSYVDSIVLLSYILAFNIDLHVNKTFIN